MRVLLYTDSNQFAGTERHILDLACGLREEGVAVRVACPADTPLAERTVTGSLDHVPIEKQGLVDWPAIWTLRRLLAANDMDIVHAHNGRTALAASMAVRLAGCGRCVATQHFLQPNHVGRRGTGRLVSDFSHKWVNRKVSKFIAISQAAHICMLERGDVAVNRIQVVENGIAEPDIANVNSRAGVRKDLGISEGAPLIACLARLEKEKDVTSLVSAMAAVIRSIPEAVCVIAGEGKLRQELECQTRDIGLAQSVRFLGYRTDALSILNASDVFVLPSLAEPFGLVILEAMALSKPVIATNAGGPREIVVHGETGLLVPPSDPEALASAILQLNSDPEKAHDMGAAGRKRYLERYTAERMAKETFEVYRKVLGRTQEQAVGVPERAMARRTL